MRHLKDGRQFGRDTSHRRAMFRALTANLLLHERIETTDAKAKELRRFADKVITSARRLGAIAYTPLEKLKPAERARRLAAQRHVGTFLQRIGTKSAGGEQTEVDLIEKVFVDLAQRYQKRAGGYTRIIKLGARRGDNAPISRIELVEGETPVLPEKKTSGKAKAASTKAAPAKAAASSTGSGQAEKKEAAPAKAASDDKAAKAPAKRAKKAASKDEG
ncbi:MAG TPA: 50S ribosomal protein L17 [Polyangiaceae bacterium]|nr:50S ribosomal protein L17 [Polyangiaceae bacterium]